MSITKITDYSDFNQYPWLVEFLKTSDVKGILEAFDRQFNDLETVFFSMILEMWLDDAIGEQLDVLGIHVGISRNGISDDSYRSLLKGKIEINTSSGTPEDLIKAFKQLYPGATDTTYTPFYPGKVQMFTNGTPILTASEIVQIIDSLLPSGVGLVFSNFDYITEGGDKLVTEAGDQLIATSFLT